HPVRVEHCFVDRSGRRPRGGHGARPHEPPHQERSGCPYRGTDARRRSAWPHGQLLMLRRWLAFLAAALALAACGLISDFHTASYVLVDSGASSCAAAIDCDAGEVCCVSTLSPLAANCRAAPCPNVAEVPLPVQLCQGNSECGSVECALQTCQLSGQPISVSS